MVVTLILGFICIFFNLIAYFNKSDWGLKLSFFLIFLFLGLRYNYGNDYLTYIELFNRVKENGDIAFDPTMYLVYEPGWMLINWIFRPIGFFGLMLVLALFYSLTFYKLIKQYVPYQYYWIAVFFMVFNSSFLLVHSSAMRQTVAILIFLLSIKYINKKKIVPFLLCILLASTFHYTCLTVLLATPFLFYSKRISLIYGFILFSCYLMFFVLGSYLVTYLNSIISLFTDKYDYYTDKGNANSGLGFVYYSLLFLLTLIYDKYQDKNKLIFFKLAIIYFMLMPFVLIIEMSARIGFYFAPATIIAYILIFKNLNPKIYRFIFLTSVMLFTFFQFFQFFYSDTYKSYFMEYQTIFSSSKWN